IGCPPTCDRVACRKAEVRRGRTRRTRHVRDAVDDQPGAADRLVRTQVTALAELLVGYGPSAFLCRMWGGKELHAFHQRLALLEGGTRIDQRLEITQLEWQGADDAKPLAWDALHGPYGGSGGWDIDDEPTVQFIAPLPL